MVVFKIISLEQSSPYVVKSHPEVSINGEWSIKEIDDSILNSKRTAFKVRAVIIDGHSANVKGFSHLVKTHGGVKKLYIYHPANNRLFKTYLLLV